ncbi:MAG: hypothetical protein KME26_19420 [Oscillatoria princeps RMCB-10]|nr:hypothetical protein [Oscillatoria princeps RMCB-10]
MSAPNPTAISLWQQPDIFSVISRFRKHQIRHFWRLMSPAKQIKATIKGEATAVIIVRLSSNPEETQGDIGGAVCDGVLQKTFRESDILDKTRRDLGVGYIYEESYCSGGEAVGQPSQLHRHVKSDANRRHWL